MDLTLDILISKRDYDFQALTKKILAVVGENLLKAARMYLGSDRNINWVRIERVPGLDNYVYIFGEVELYEGDLIDTATGQQVVTAETLSSFKNTLKLAVNLDILQNRTVDDIYNHLRFIKDIASKVNDYELVEILRHSPIDDSILLNTPAFSDILEKITRPAFLDSFKLEQLSDKQITSFRMCTNIAKGTVQ